MFDLFGEYKTLARDTLFAPFHLIDLSQIPDTQLEKYFWSGVLTRTMKHIYERDLLPFFKKALIKDLQIIEKEGKEDYISLIVTYVTVAGEMSDSKEFLNILENGLSEKTREGVMTVAEQLRQEGWLAGIAESEAKEARGKVEGKIEALRTMALKLLREGMSIDRVAELTELSEDDIEKIE